MEHVRDIVIVGGGSSGWMTAALMSKLLGQRYRIRVIESKSIGTIGVGEATIPAIKTFHSLLGLDEREFMAATQATCKLGIQFVDWGRIGDSYIHGFGPIGKQWGWLSFYQYWLKIHLAGQAQHLDQFSINTRMALEGRFAQANPKTPKSPLSEIAYAYHLDASLYANFLQKFSEKNGVEHIEGKVIQVKQDVDSGYITQLVLEDGSKIDGDFFVDCTGMRGLLIEETLRTGFESWSHWLPCDSALAVPCASRPQISPMTRSTARDAGWQWRIPLQHRIGNGLVYSSQFSSDEQVAETLLGNLDGDVLAEPRLIRFQTGRRHKAWNKNCVAIGLSSGFLEPLESTSLYLVQSAIIRLISLFPDRHIAQANIDQYNKQTDFEIEHIRDFIIAHYSTTERKDSPFWMYCQNMQEPDSLEQKKAIFKAYGRVDREADELFREESWVQVLIGQRFVPHSYAPLVDLKPADEVANFIENIRLVIEKCALSLPTHNEFLSSYCAAIDT